MGDQAAPRARRDTAGPHAQRLGDRPARRARGGAHHRGRHRVLPGQLPAGLFGGRMLGDRVPLSRGARRHLRLAGDRTARPADRQRPARVQGALRPQVHPCPAEHLPDGGIARLHVHGEVVPDPAMLSGLTTDLAALENGADVVASNDQNYYSPPRNVISPGLSRVMHEGWETRRRRRPGHEWLVIRLAVQGVIELAEIDTSWFRGNQPDLASLQVLDAAAGASPSDESAWHDLLS